MPRYLVERSFPEGLNVPICADGARSIDSIVEQNMEERVTWVQSYVSPDKRTTYCIYEGPSPDAIRRAAHRNGLPVDRVTEIRTLDPYFYY